MSLPHAHGPRPRPTRRLCIGTVLSLAAALAACQRPPLPEPPPQLRTHLRVLDDASGQSDGRLQSASHVFLDGDARPTLTSAKPFPPKLDCDPAKQLVPRPCRASAPSQMPAAPHAVVSGPITPESFLAEQASVAQPTAAPAESDGATGDVVPHHGRSSAPHLKTATLVTADAKTPLGSLTAAQMVMSRAFAVPPLDERALATGSFTVPPGALLRLSIGIEEPAWLLDSAPVSFRVVMEEKDGSQQDLFRRTLDPFRRAGDRRWFDDDVDLSDIAGKTVRLRFLTEPAQSGDTRPSLPVWGDPRVLAPAAAAAKRPSIVLVSLDTMRARSMSLYGNTRETTPRLTALAARGALFENAFTTFSNTLPSHMSMLTGLYPASHGVLTTNDELGSDHGLLAEALRGAGYATAAFTEDALLDSRRGFRRGFSTYYENTAVADGTGDVEHTFGRALEWAGRHADEPFFLFVHTYEVHMPYQPPAAYQGLFADSTLTSLRAYEQEIRYVDDVLARLVAGLHRVVPDQDLILVVTADHGEEFFEHGYIAHNQLYEEVMHVPLVMVWPGRIPAGLRIATPVSLVDLVPTILSLLELPVQQRLDGVSLVPLLAGDAQTLDRPAVLGEYPPSSYVRERQFVSRSAGAKCIVTASGDGDRCFDLQSDPDERHPRGTTESAAFVQLSELAEEYRTRSLAARRRALASRTATTAGSPADGATDEAAPPPGDASPARPDEPAAPDDAVQRKMRALGYVE